MEAAALQQIGGLQTFHNQNVFRHLAAGVLAKQMDEGDLHELHKSFCAMDKDENGVVTFAEFKEVLKVIDYTEFVAACLDHKAATFRVEQEEGICWAAFQVFDKDCSGTVTYEELQQVLLWQELTGGDDDNQAIQTLPHFVLQITCRGGVRAQDIKEVSKPAPAAAVPAAPSLNALPIARRQHGAVASMGLPVKEGHFIPGRDFRFVRALLYQGVFEIFSSTLKACVQGRSLEDVTLEI
ncbi:Calcium-dependent protein kinase 12 [Symbiodinium microadriaticum]|uniref:Calcium-dependent protein kinase 12 n=1 Tax=Symbiodinium microadriaticum TaxID=2951 RepID=A0A1Q9DAG1_SYMMI|nr:Calcium-dependent protein kinase 12 [Symbiodinium microadriaticum]